MAELRAFCQHDARRPSWRRSGRESAMISESRPAGCVVRGALLPRSPTSGRPIPRGMASGFLSITLGRGLNYHRSGACGGRAAGPLGAWPDYPRSAAAAAALGPFNYPRSGPEAEAGALRITIGRGLGKRGRSELPWALRITLGRGPGEGRALRITIGRGPGWPDYPRSGRPSVPAAAPVP
jgi:hypothetical protein